MICLPKTTRVNTPTWRDGWTTANGKSKKGFWRFRLDGGYISLASYGAPDEHGTGRREQSRNLALATQARDRYLVEADRAAAADQAACVADVCNLFIKYKLPSDSLEHQKAVARHLHAFCVGHAGGKTISAYQGWGLLAPEEISETTLEQWAAHHTWGLSGKRGPYMAVKAAFAFAASHTAAGTAATGREPAYIDRNPLANLKPKRAKARKLFFADDQAAQFIAQADVIDPLFSRLFQVLLGTGTRPGELRKARGRHVRVVGDRVAIVLQEDEWKCGKRLHQVRAITLPTQWSAWIVERAAQVGLHGHLFVTDRGTPWGKSTFALRFRQIRAAAGLPDGLVPYGARHAFITRCGKRGLSPKLVANACGTSPQIIAGVYDHSAEDIMSNATVIDAVGW